VCVGLNRMSVMFKAQTGCSEFAILRLILVHLSALAFVIQGVSKKALQWFSKCCCVASVTFAFKVMNNG
jgi:hypothetical protein